MQLFRNRAAVSTTTLLSESSLKTLQAGSGGVVASLAMAATAEIERIELWGAIYTIFYRGENHSLG